MKKIYHANNNQKSVEVSLLIKDKRDFETKIVARYKGHLLMIKEPIHQEYVTIININAHDTSSLKYMRLKLT